MKSLLKNIKYAVLAGALMFPFYSKAETQTISLTANWNLVGFQVIPNDPTPEGVFGKLSGLQMVWTYDAEQKQWRRYAKPSGTGTQQENANLANDMLSIGTVEPGKAYWVYMSKAESLTVSGSLPDAVTFPALEFSNGWNMFSIPVGATEVSEAGSVSLLSVLAGAGLDYDTLLTWENSRYSKMFNVDDADESNPLSGIKPDAPLPNFDFSKDLGRGYMIHVKDAVDPAVLRPRMLLTVRPDVDEEPKGNFPSKEDLNVSLASDQSEFKDVANQDVIHFFADEDVQSLYISNTGGGVMLWTAEWRSSDADKAAGDWIHLSDVPLKQWDTNNACDKVSGVTTLEDDIVYLNLDRKNLGRGNHYGKLILNTSVGQMVYDVVAEVSGLQGDFTGFAEIISVNGKQNKVPDIDLNISFYEDIRIGGLLRGYIDSSRSLLWPSDVPLVGYRVADEGNQFMLSGSFVLPPGDQNGEPFDKFMKDSDGNTATSIVGEDVDWNRNGAIDAKNPFPFPIQRLVTLEGTLNNANPAEGWVIQGTYKEMVYGMMAEPIELLGTFTLNRRNIRPFTFRKVVKRVDYDGDTGVEPVVEKDGTIASSISQGGQRDSKIEVATEMELQGLQVSLDFSKLEHSNIKVELKSPQGTSLVIFDGLAQSDSVNPNTLKSITFPTDRPTDGDMNAFIKGIQQTRTDSEKSRYWTLTVSNRGNDTVKLSRWSLRLEGQPVSDVSGIVKDNKGNPVAGAKVALNGVAFSQYSNTTDASGKFTMERVPLLPLDFTVQLPGYVSADPDSTGLSAGFRTPYSKISETTTPLEAKLIEHFNPLAGATVAFADVEGFEDGTEDSPFELEISPDTESGEVVLIAGPVEASVGSTVDYVAVGASASNRWNMGDGTTKRNEIAVNYEYKKSGVYTVQFTSGSKTYETQVVALPAPGHAPAKPADLAGEPTGLSSTTQNKNYKAYVFQSSFTSAGTYVESDVKPSDYDPSAAAVTMTYMPVQYAYTASMDIDLAPKVTAGKSKSYDSDGFIPLDGNKNNASNVNNYGFRNEDFDYALTPALWRDTKNVNKELEYKQDTSVDKTGLMIWGHSYSDDIGISHFSNYLYPDISYFALDGVSYSIDSVDNTYHPNKGTSVHDKDDDWCETVTHYCMACSISSSMSINFVGEPPLVSVKEAKLSRMDVDNPLDPTLSVAPVPVLRNLRYQLNTGVIGCAQ